MGLLFTLIACYRSVFVSRYLYQYGWFDTLFNSSLLIRTLAWCAEISFSCLIAFATAGLITKSRLAFAIEETLWSVGFLSILPLAYMQFRRIFMSHEKLTADRLSMLKAFAIINLTWCIIYCTYGLTYHLPTEYWLTAFEQIRTGVPELKSGFSAIVDAFSVVNVTHDYRDWGFGFVFWHSSYFTVCVWIALFLMRAPRLKS